MTDSTAWTIAGKICIITGANTGIGKATALELTRRGAGKIILACRNLSAANEAAADIREKASLSSDEGNRRVVVKLLDLSSLKSVRQFANEILASEPQLHVLVNNAGLECPNGKQLSADGYEMTFAVNHLGHFLLTNLLLDLMKKSAPSRIVVVASRLLKYNWPGGIDLKDPNQEHRSYNAGRAYRQSKLANALFALELHRRLNQGNAAAKGVSVFCLCPGVVNSDFIRNRRDGTCSCFIQWFFKHGKTVEQGAMTPVYCACEPRLEQFSGCYFQEEKLNSVPGYARDPSKSEALWELSKQLVERHDS